MLIFLSLSQPAGLKQTKPVFYLDCVIRLMTWITWKQRPFQQRGQEYGTLDRRSYAQGICKAGHNSYPPWLMCRKELPHIASRTFASAAEWNQSTPLCNHSLSLVWQYSLSEKIKISLFKRHESVEYGKLTFVTTTTISSPKLRVRTPSGRGRRWSVPSSSPSMWRDVRLSWAVSNSSPGST